MEEQALVHKEHNEVLEPLDGRETSVAAVKFESLLLLKFQEKQMFQALQRNQLIARHHFKSSCL